MVRITNPYAIAILMMVWAAMMAYYVREAGRDIREWAQRTLAAKFQQRWAHYGYPQLPTPLSNKSDKELALEQIRYYRDEVTEFIKEARVLVSRGLRLGLSRRRSLQVC